MYNCVLYRAESKEKYMKKNGRLFFCCIIFVLIKNCLRFVVPCSSHCTEQNIIFFALLKLRTRLRLFFTHTHQNTFAVAHRSIFCCFSHFGFAYFFSSLRYRFIFFSHLFLLLKRQTRSSSEEKTLRSFFYISYASS